MGEEKSNIFDVLGTIRKFHPVAFVLLLVLMYTSVTVFNLDMPIQEKILPVTISSSLYVIGSLFEFYRIDKQKQWGII